MRKTKHRESPYNALCVTLQELAGMLGCGLSTARNVGQEAGAKVCIGRRRLYYVPKVEAYINRLTEECDE